MRLVLSHFPGVKPHEAFIVGDQIDRDVVCAHLVSVRSVFFGLAPYNREANTRSLAHGHIPDFSILDFRQLPMVVKVLDADATFINEQKSTKFEEDCELSE